MAKLAAPLVPCRTIVSTNVLGSGISVLRSDSKFPAYCFGKRAKCGKAGCTNGEAHFDSRPDGNVQRRPWDRVSLARCKFIRFVVVVQTHKENLDH